MARGRMLNKTVCHSKKFDLLPDETCRLFATWCISHLDMHGVFYADPQLVRSLVFPRRKDVSNADVEGYLDAMAQVELIVRFESNGELWQYWPGFEHNQIGIRYDRESTEFPTPPGWNPPKLPEYVQPNGGQNPAERKLKEVKVKKKLSEADGANAPEPPHHPAIDVYRSKARRFPDRAQWPAITEAVKTDEASLQFWGTVVEAYILCGWYKGNISGMLDWYNRHQIPHTGNGKGPNVTPQPAAPMTPEEQQAEFERLNPHYGKAKQNAVSA